MLLFFFRGIFRHGAIVIEKHANCRGVIVIVLAISGCPEVGKQEPGCHDEAYKNEEKYNFHCRWLLFFALKLAARSGPYISARMI